MARFSTGRFPAGFFDLTQDLARGLPADVIDRWLRGDPSPERATALLAPTAVTGCVVSTDAAGLTRLSGERSVIEILALVQQPKEIVFAHGAALGGEAIGVWAADNTQMLYPESVPVGDVLGGVLAAMDRVNRECAVRFGAAVHRGRFYRLSGGLYGAEADRVEWLAEDHAGAGEILVSAETATLAPAFRCEPHPRHKGVCRVLDGPRSGLPPASGRYPAPFPDDFQDALAAWPNIGPTAMRYHRKRAVALIEHDREESDVPEVAVLNDLAMAMAMRRVGERLLQGLDGKEIKTTATISIFTFESCADALQFAHLFRAEMAERGINCRTGIDYGDVFEFPLDGGMWDIAGMPVNLASKMAQDRGELGYIYLTAAAAERSGPTDWMKPVTVSVGGVEIPAFLG